MKVYETDEVIEYLKSRRIIKPYLKSKQYFELGYKQLINLKILKPKKNQLYQFRITKKYRAIGYFKENGFLVIEISDHQ
ncbi:MAG TPA: hypothetical protein ENK91_04950 [Bacteroidetes bacterium]|nr:hypothetical protein [Bacteroidota bacterium]